MRSQRCSFRDRSRKGRRSAAGARLAAALGAFSVLSTCGDGGGTVSPGTDSSGTGASGAAPSGTASSGTGAGGGPCLPSKCPDPGECATPICVTDHRCGTANEPAGTACTSGGKVCDGSGKCVACISDSDCTDKAKPVCGDGACEGATCRNGMLDGDESGVDCGGSCPGCPNGKPCKVGADCATGYCADDGLCKACKESTQCSTDTWCDPLISGGGCVADLAPGEACAEGAQCPADACKDGFCCNTPCSGICQACSKDKTGQPNGTCASVPAGTDPDNDCGGAFCDGAGTCGSCSEQVALGYYHTCARKKDGTLWCWGNNNYAQLGNGTDQEKASPVQVSLLGATVIDVALGYDHTCGRKKDGTLWCWGRNDSGQLGDGTSTGKSSPVQIVALAATAVDVVLGDYHSCARKQDGTLWCWGHNDSGQLGDGTTVKKSSPAQVPALGATVVEVSLGGAHSCARKQDGTLWCWGRNDYGQLGDGTTVQKSSPVQVPVLGATVVEVSLGGAHSCARKQDGTLWCWGANYNGQLGDDTTASTSSPVQVFVLGNSVIEVALGDRHGCARKQDGTLWCWGANYDGQLGDGTKAQKSSPVQVVALGATVVEVALGGAHTCARKQDGTLWCWGANSSYGQLGDGTKAQKSLPVKVPLCL
jgi:alpha-tubulin suppressor-like RCC1 family protein